MCRKIFLCKKMYHVVIICETYVHEKGVAWHLCKFIIHKIRCSNQKHKTTKLLHRHQWAHKVHPDTSTHLSSFHTTNSSIKAHSCWTWELCSSLTPYYTAWLARERWVLKKQQWRWHSFTHGRRTRVQVLAGNILILYTGEEEKESLVIGNSPFISELKWQAGIRIRRSLWTTGRIREGDQRMSITLHSFWNYILNSRSGQAVACNPTYHLS